jgi:hypothetical protein
MYQSVERYMKRVMPLITTAKLTVAHNTSQLNGPHTTPSAWRLTSQRINQMHQFTKVKSSSDTL